MAQTKRDIELRHRIMEIIHKYPDLERKDLISAIQAMCACSKRTAIEHYEAWKIQKRLGDYKTNAD